MAVGLGDIELCFAFWIVRRDNVVGIVERCFEFSDDFWADVIICW